MMAKIYLAIGLILGFAIGWMVKMVRDYKLYKDIIAMTSETTKLWERLPGERVEN